MALTVRWTPMALADLNTAYEFIYADKPRAAKTVVSKILDGIDQLKNYPESGKDGRVGGTRELFVNTTPYFIVYRVKDKTLEILAVLHSSRRWP